MNCSSLTETRRKYIHVGSMPRAYMDVGGRAMHGAIADTMRATVSVKDEQLLSLELTRLCP